MGFSTQQYHKEQVERRWKINPIWRGIGCFLIILIPIMAWFAATLFLDFDQPLYRSQDFSKPFELNYTQIVEIDRVIADINRFAATNNLVMGQLFYFVIFTVIGYGLLAFVYALLYKVVGPPRYGPFDVPPDVMRR